MGKGTCQSCGMPLSKDPEGGGTETNGSLSIKYCSLCYQNGKFLEPHLTVDQMIAKVKRVMHEQMYIPNFLAGLFAKRTRKLERWKNG